MDKNILSHIKFNDFFYSIEVVKLNNFISFYASLNIERIIQTHSIKRSQMKVWGTRKTFFNNWARLWNKNQLKKKIEDRLDSI